MSTPTACRRCGNKTHDDNHCKEKHDILGKTKTLWQASKRRNQEARRKLEIEWIFKFQGGKALFDALTRLGEDTNVPQLADYNAAQAAQQNASAAAPIPPAVRPTGPVGRGVAVIGALSKADDSSKLPAKPAIASSARRVKTAEDKAEQEILSSAPRVKTLAEEALDQLFDDCRPDDIPERTQPNQQDTPLNSALTQSKLTAHQIKVHADADAIIDLRKREKKESPAAIQSDYHSLRVGFCESGREETVLTNHVVITQMPVRLWKYTTGGLPNSATRKKKILLVKTMIKRMPFLHDNQQHFTYDSNGIFYSRVDLHALAVNDTRFVSTSNSTGGNCRMETKIPCSRPANQGGNHIIHVYLEGRRLANVDLAAFVNAYQGAPLQQDDNVLEIANALNSIVAKASAAVTLDQHRTFQIGANKFFLCSGYRELGNLRSSILQTNVGFSSSAKAGMGSGLLNINVATSAFYQPLRVDDYIRRARMPANTEIARKEAMGLKRVRVYINCERGTDGKGGIAGQDQEVNRDERRFRAIFGLGNACSRQTFDVQGTEYTVANFQLKKYCRTLTHGNLNAVNLGGPGRAEWYAPEHLTILPYQPWRGLLPDNLKDEMIGQACKYPLQSVAAIVERGVQALGITVPAGSPSPLADFGLTIDKNLMVVPSRILDPPIVQYSGAQISMRFLKSGKWNLKNTKFITRPKLTHIRFLRPHNLDFEKFERNLKPQMKVYLGCGEVSFTNIGAPVDLNADFENLENQLSKLGDADPKKNRPELLVFVNPYADKAAYSRFRIACDRTLGIPSICLKSRNVNGSALSEQYFANNAMKINSRIGGINHKADLRPYLPDGIELDRTMILGADVTHPGSGAVPGTASLAALVGTVDKECLEYRGSSRPNMPREEMIEHFEVMLKDLLKLWQNKHSGSLPKYIIYFRDGVSESQYLAVRRAEVDKINKVVADVRGSVEDPPQVTAIVVTKRHHTRFYKNPPKEPKQRPSGAVEGDTNTPVGTCVDKDVTHYLYNSFFIQSHAAIKGTARPAHYFVLQDDTNSTSDRLQNLVHALSYTYARTTGSVSYAVPAYYADRLCDRLRHYWPSWFSGNLNLSIPKGIPEGQDPFEHGRDLFRTLWGLPGYDGAADPTAVNPWNEKLNDKMFWL